MEILGIKFAPLNIPLERRLQTLAVLYANFSFMCGGILGIFLSIYLFFFSDYYYVPIFYFAWYVYDQDTPKRGARHSTWVRNWKLWKYVCDYFPIELIKTAELDPDKNYIMGYHPHGIVSSGAFCCFATEATGFSNLFPGIRPHMLTLNINFRFPFSRELILLYGSCSVDKDSIQWILTQQGKGNAAVIVIGGAQEALDAHRGSYTLTLRKRKGFVRCALETGADLVPVFSFGENDIFHQVKNPPGSTLRWIQETVKRYTGISPALFYGRGVFQYSWGYVPYRSKITVVVGQPIHVEQVENPTEEQVNGLHEKYIAELTQLFESHKTKYGAGDADLRVI